MAAPVGVPNETLDHALALGDLSLGVGVVEQGSLGKGPASAADVEWYSFTLDQPAKITAELGRLDQSSSFQGVLSLFNNDPFDFGDPFDADGHRLMEQNVAPSDGGVAKLDRLLGPGTYELAVSGSGNLDFHPLLADSGLPGSTGDFNLQISTSDAGVWSGTGPAVLTTDPASNVSLSSSPLAIRLNLSGPLDPSTLIAGQTVQLISSPTGNFAQDGQQVALASINFSSSINELQLFPASPLAPDHYEVLLQGQSVGGSQVVADPNGNDLNADADHPDGQDFTSTFQVVGIDGHTVRMPHRTTPRPPRTTWAT